MLVSYSPEELLQGFRRLYALVELGFGTDAYTVKSIRSVPYQTVFLLCPSYGRHTEARNRLVNQALPFTLVSNFYFPAR